MNLLDDYVCMTWLGGTGGVNHVDWSALSGRFVTIWPDAEEGGIKAAKIVAQHCRRVGAASVKVIDLPAGLPKGFDIADDLSLLDDLL